MPPRAASGTDVEHHDDEVAAIMTTSSKPRLFLTRRIPEPGFALAHELFDVTGGDEDRGLPREQLLAGVAGGAGAALSAQREHRRRRHGRRRPRVCGSSPTWRWASTTST